MMQMQLQRESREYNTISNVRKVRHDSATYGSWPRRSFGSWQRSASTNPSRFASVTQSPGDFSIAVRALAARMALEAIRQF